jgi:universal stress protein A
MATLAPGSNVETRSHLVLVVGVDLSQVSEHLLMTARDLVMLARDAEIHIVHVVEPQAMAATMFDALPIVAPTEPERVRAAQEELDRLCARVAEGINARVIVHVAVGRPSDEITRIADAVGAHVIVVEKHESRGLARVFHRSLAATLAKKAPCSVLTVRARSPADRTSSMPPPSSADEVATKAFPFQA